MSNPLIYLDHHATTPMDERVFLAMKPFFLSQFGNPASYHTLGWQAQEAVDQARYQVARAINAHPTEIIFTSGATESTNLAIKGLLASTAHSFPHLITSSIEHKATLSTIASLAPKVSADFISPKKEGQITKEDVLAAIKDQTALVSLFMVHNEIGSINEIKSIALAVKSRGLLFHCDAAQALGRVPIDCQELSIDMMSLSGHKIYGPKGVGCLYIRKEIMDLICPQIHGGGQEWSKRSGTLNVPGIVGMGEAARLAVLNIEQENHRISGLRDRLWDNLSVLEGIFLNGSLKDRVSANLNVSFAGVDGEELLLSICHQVALSTGSACSSMVGGKNRVLEELGVPVDLCQSSLRFGLGRSTTREEIDRASELVVEKVKTLRDKGQNKLVGLKKK